MDEEEGDDDSGEPQRYTISHVWLLALLLSGAAVFLAALWASGGAIAQFLGITKE